MANPLTLNLCGYPDGQAGLPSGDDNPDNRLSLKHWAAGVYSYALGGWLDPPEHVTDAQRWQRFVDQMEQSRIDTGGDPFTTGPGSEQAGIDAYENKVNNRLAVGLTEALQWALHVEQELALCEGRHKTPDEIEEEILGP